MMNAKDKAALIANGFQAGEIHAALNGYMYGYETPETVPHSGAVVLAIKRLGSSGNGSRLDEYVSFQQFYLDDDMDMDIIMQEYTARGVMIERALKRQEISL